MRIDESGVSAISPFIISDELGYFKMYNESDSKLLLPLMRTCLVIMWILTLKEKSFAVYLICDDNDD